MTEKSPLYPPESIDWNRVDLNSPFNLTATLKSGQSFRWSQNENGVWLGVVGKVAMALWQAENGPDSPLFWQTFPEAGQWTAVEDYFRLNVDLEPLYRDWILNEQAMEFAVKTFRGLRILRQPPEECFFGFQCATCNTVVKIERSVRKLAERYGESIACPHLNVVETLKPLYVFPSLTALAGADERELRADLWGYRAPRVINLAKHLLTLPEGWLISQRGVSHAEARTSLTKMHGIGAKLADCISLFCLDKDESVPVDTHVWQIACNLFTPELRGKSLTPKVYDTIVDGWRNRFGGYAGWAQQYLFAAELKRPASSITR